MAAILSNLSQLERRLDITLVTGEVEAEVQQRLKHLASSVKMNGFRPGKVPFTVVARQYSEQVRREVLDDALRKNFSDAVREQNLKIAGYPSFEAKTPDAALPTEFSATFEVYPEVKLGDLSTVIIKRPGIELGEADVEKTIEVMRKQRATYAVAERAAAAADQVTIDFVGTKDGVEFEGGKATDFNVVLGEGRLLKDFEDQLIGMKSGESKKFEVVFPADYQAKDLAGKPVSFDVKVKQVSAPQLPAVDAEFAKSLGVADGNLETMRAEIRANLERETTARVAARVKDQIMQALIDHTQLDVPKSLAQLEVGRLMEATHRDLQARGVKAADMQLPPEVFQEQAQRRVRLGLILAEVVKAHGLQAKPEQVRAMVERQAESYEHPQEVVKWFYDVPERLGDIESSVLEENVVTWALATAKVQDETIAIDDLMGTGK